MFISHLMNYRQAFQTFAVVFFSRNFFLLMIIEQRNGICVWFCLGAFLGTEILSI